MGPVFYVMAILGCADSEASCRDVRLPDTHYETADACRAATHDALLANSDLDYPVVTAACRPGNRTLAAAEPRPHG